MSKCRSYVEHARHAARIAGDYLRSSFRDETVLEIERKGLHDYVTAVDRCAEEKIVDYLSAQFPDHSFLAEEGASATGQDGPRWIIDPLDGTTNFIHGVPVFAVSIALEDHLGLGAGVIYDPVHDAMYHAERDGGAWLDDAPISCSGTESLDESLIATGFPFREFAKIDGYLASFRKLMLGTSGIRRAGSAAMDLAFTACGRYDGFWETGLSPWDMAAGALLVKEAGGMVSDFNGGDGFLETGEIVASGRVLHHYLLEVTREHLL